MTYQQICYARLGKQEAWAGWQTFNATPGITAAASTSFSGFQKGDMGTITTVDARYEGRQNFVLRADDSSVFLMSFKYGFADQTGRPTAFCHSLVFDRDEFERDPQVALDVERSSFGWTEEDTKPENQHVTVAPRMSLDEALRQCGLDDQGLASLLDMTCEALGFDRRNDAQFGTKGAYWHEDPKTRTPFYIVCDCSEETIRAALVCIYVGLPYGLRSRVSFCTLLDSRGNPINKANPVSVTFVQKAPRRAKAFVLAAPAVEKDNPRPTFATEVAQNVAGSRAYLDDLERCAGEFCDPGAGSCLAYEVAARGAEGVDLAGSAAIREYLELPVPDDPARRAAHDRMLAWAIRESKAQNASYPDAINDQLSAQVAASSSQDLKDAGFEYRIWLLTRLTPGEAAQRLGHDFPTPEARDSEDFIDTRDELMRTQGGRDILRRLYGSIEQDLVSSGLTEEKIDAFLAELASADPAWRSERESGLWQTFILSHVKPGVDPGELADFLDEYRRCGAQAQEVSAKACAAYWKGFDFSGYDYDWERYERLAVEGSPECDAARTAARLLASAQQAGSQGVSNASLDDAEGGVEDALSDYDEASGGVDEQVQRTLDRGVLQRLLAMRKSALENGLVSADPARRDLWTDVGLWYDFGQLAVVRGGIVNPTQFLLEQHIIPADRKTLDVALEANLENDDGDLQRCLRQDCENLKKAPDPDVKKGAHALMKGLDRYAKAAAKRPKPQPVLQPQQSGVPYEWPDQAGRDPYSGYDDGGQDAYSGYDDAGGYADSRAQGASYGPQAYAPSSYESGETPPIHYSSDPGYGSQPYGSGADVRGSAYSANSSYGRQDAYGAQAPYQGGSARHAESGETPPVRKGGSAQQVASMGDRRVYVPPQGRHAARLAYGAESGETLPVRQRPSQQPTPRSPQRPQAQEDDTAKPKRGGFLGGLFGKKKGK